ncbi:MAG: hypothetical protein E7443_01875 [Ruminococcaceae bacterium]|nr:hypothetical protein [Oscillospiraceae bacterium]
MAFWKKSEDPWDIDPEKKRRKEKPVFENLSEPEEKEEEKSFLADLFKKKETPEEEDVPVPCPYCGETMKKGYLKGGRDRVYWSEMKPGFLSALDEAWLISDEGGFWTAAYRTCHVCLTCRKLVADVPDTAGSMNYAWESGRPVLPEEQEEAKEK